VAYTYHDVLALVGAGSAHPGGFAATVEFLHYLRPDVGTRLLDAGCGTGRTACYAAKKYGASVTGVDVHPLMIEKARARAEAEGVEVNFVVGDVTGLPFDAGSFDLVVAESVTVFVDPGKAVREYHRVLGPGGTVGDLEMAALQRLPVEAERALCSFYGARQVPTFSQWHKMYGKAGFHSVMLWKPRAVDIEAGTASDLEFPDEWQQTSPEAYTDEEVGIVLRRNVEMMERYQRYLGYTGIVAAKK
jgi:arsenite methyltransferase